MAMESLRGYLLSTVRYGESDGILSLYVRDQGYTSCFLKGAFGSKSRSKAYLQPLMPLEVRLRDQRARGTLATALKVEPTDTSPTEWDLVDTSMLFFASDFLNQILRQEPYHSKVYTAIGEFHDALKEKSRSAHLGLMYQMLELQGLSPLTGPAAFLNPQEGTYQDTPVHPLLSRELSTLWKEMAAAENPLRHLVASGQRAAFLDSLILYFSFHYPGFKIPASLAVLKELFE